MSRLAGRLRSPKIVETRGLSRAEGECGLPPKRTPIGAGNTKRALDPDFPVSEKRKSCYAFLVVPQVRRAGEFGGGDLGTAGGARNLRACEISLFDLQRLDFPENAQSIPWKRLEKSAENLEMFGVDLEMRRRLQPIPCAPRPASPRKRGEAR
jgi:hypothetical protein